VKPHEEQYTYHALRMLRYLIAEIEAGRLVARAGAHTSHTMAGDCDYRFLLREAVSWQE